MPRSSIGSFPGVGEFAYIRVRNAEDLCCLRGGEELCDWPEGDAVPGSEVGQELHDGIADRRRNLDAHAVEHQRGRVRRGCGSLGQSCLDSLGSIAVDCGNDVVDAHAVYLRSKAVFRKHRQRQCPSARWLAPCALHYMSAVSGKLFTHVDRNSKVLAPKDIRLDAYVTHQIWCTRK